MNYPKIIDDLIDIFSSFSGVGKRSAERMVLGMLKWNKDKILFASDTLKQFNDIISFCPECGNLSAENELCFICKSYSRNKNIICLVEDFTQIKNIEESFFKGVYHVLGGKMSPLTGVNIEDLNIDSLIKRINTYNTKEVILALSQDVEGQATAIYISNLLKEKGIIVSKLAQGLPAGSDITFADSATISAAMNGRIKY